MNLLKKQLIVVACFVFSAAQGASSLVRGRLLWPPTTEAMAAEVVALKKRSITQPLLFEMINSADSSRHWLLGVEPSGVYLGENFPLDSPLFTALAETTTFLFDNISFAQIPQRLLDELETLKTLRGELPADFDLQQQLGNEHWSTLRQTLREHPGVPDDPDERHRTAMKIQKGHPIMAIDLLTTDILMLSMEDSMLAEQIDSIAVERNKKVVNLASAEQEFEALREYYTTVYSQASVDDVREIVDRGGIKFVMESNLAELDAYFVGDAEELMRHYHQARTGFLQRQDAILVSGRNRTWLANGAIQENCRTGETCFITVSFEHLFYGEDNLIKLLREKDFVINRFNPATEP